MVIKPGALATIQDAGRAGLRRYGIPPAGAMDQFSYRIGNVLVGNSGDNRLKGGLGSDTYVHEVQGGDDVIEETGPQADTLLFGEGITADMARVKRRHDDLVVELSGEHGSVTVKGWFASSSKRVESIQFADGTTWNEQQIRSRAQQQHDDDCGFPGDGHDDDDHHRAHPSSEDRDPKDKHGDDKRDPGYAWGGGRRRFDFEELHELLGQGQGRAMAKDEIATRWRAVAEHGAYDGAGEGAWLPTHGERVPGSTRWGFEGSIGATRGQDTLKTLEGLLEGFRKL